MSQLIIFVKSSPFINIILLISRRFFFFRDVYFITMPVWFLSQTGWIIVVSEYFIYSLEGKFVASG